MLFAGALIVHNTPLATLFSNIVQLQLWVTLHGWAGIVGYIALFVVASLFLFPGSMLVIAGGVLFGVWQGTLISLLAATLASSLSFLLARYLGRDWLLARFGHSPRFQKIDAGISFYGVDFLIFTRLVPMFPYNLQNYVYGLTAIPFWRYCWISAVTMLPGIWMYSYMAHQLAARGITWDTGGRLLACGMVIFALTWCARRIYQKKIGGS